MDTVEDFRLFSPESGRDRRSNLRALISNPRASTFQKIDGHEYKFDPENIPASERSPTLITTTLNTAAYTVPRPPLPPSPHYDRYDRESSIYSGVTTPTTARHTRLIALHLSNEISLSDTPRSSVKTILSRVSKAPTATPMSAVFSTRATEAAATEVATPSTMRSAYSSVVPPIPSATSSQRNSSTSRSRLQRVTVHWDSKTNCAPFLELRRFSQLDLDSMLTNLDHFHEPAGLRVKSMPTSWDVDTSAMAKDDTEVLRSPTRAGTIKASRQLHFRRTLAGIESGRHKIVSSSTVASLDVVHALAGQFPPTPTPALPAQVLAALQKQAEQAAEQAEESFEESSDEQAEGPADEPSEGQLKGEEQLEEQLKTPILARPEPALFRPSSIHRSSVNSISLQRPPSIVRRSIPSLDAFAKTMSETRNSIPFSLTSTSSISSDSLFSSRPRPESVYSMASETSVPLEERTRKAMTLPAKAKAQDIPDFTKMPSLPIDVMQTSGTLEQNDQSPETILAESEGIFSAEPEPLSPAVEADESAMTSRRRSGSLSNIVLAAESATEKIRGRSRAATVSSGSFSADDVNSTEERRRKGRTLPPKRRSGTLPKSLFFKAQALRRDSAESGVTEPEVADEPESTFRVDLNVADSNADSIASSSSAQERSRKARTLPPKARTEQPQVEELPNRRQTMAPLSIEPAKSPVLALPISQEPNPATSQPRSPGERAKKAMTLPPNARSPLDESATTDFPVPDSSSERASRSQLSRHKSVGSAPKKNTTTSTQTIFGRGSIIVEWLTPPVKAVQDSKAFGGNKLRKRSRSRPRVDAEVARAAVEVGAEESI